MKIAIPHDELLKALNVVANVVPAKTPLPILTSILVDAQEGGVRFSATNLDVSVSTLAGKAAVKQKGRAAIPAAKFVAFVRSLAPGEVTIEQKGGRLLVKAGKAALEEPAMNPDEFPALPLIGSSKTIEMPATSLADMVKATAYAVSRDETRPALGGILWEVRGQRLRMVATDAHRLSKVERQLAADTREDRSLIADTQGLLHFVRLAESAESVHIHLGPSQLSFRLGETELHTRLIDGPFPDYEAVIPKQNDKLVTLDRELFAQAVRRVAITADRMTNQIRLGVESGRMELSATGADGSRAEDEIQVDYQGEALEIGFNHTYLQDVVRNLRGAAVQMAIKDAQSAVLITPASAADEAEDLLCLLMPLRLTAE